MPFCIAMVNGRPLCAAARRRTRPSWSRAPARARCSRRCAGARATLPQIDVVSIVAPDGRLIAFSRDFPVPPVSLADRDYMRAHLASPTLDVYLSAPVRNRGTGRWDVLPRAQDPQPGRTHGRHRDRGHRVRVLPAFLRIDRLRPRRHHGAAAAARRHPARARAAQRRAGGHELQVQRDLPPADRPGRGRRRAPPSWPARASPTAATSGPRRHRAHGVARLSGGRQHHRDRRPDAGALAPHDVAAGGAHAERRPADRRPRDHGCTGCWNAGATCWPSSTAPAPPRRRPTAPRPRSSPT